jgi:hypothetical protein
MINYKDKEELQSAYSAMSIRDIAAACEVSAPTIRHYMKKFNIKSRCISDGMLLKSQYISQYASNYWADESHRRQQSQKLRSIQANRKKELTKSAKKNWEHNREALTAGIKRATTDNKKAKISSSLKKSWTQDRRAIQSDITSSLWQDPEYSIKTLQGLNAVTSSDEFKQKVSINSKRMWKSRSYRQKQAAAISNLPPTSILDKLVIKYLQSINIDAKPISLGPWSFDVGFSYDGRNILIECQGEYWHSIPERITRDKQKSTYFKKHLSNQWELHYIYEYQFYGLNSIKHILDGILNFTTQQKPFNFKDIKLVPIDKNTANGFLNLYHYLSKGRAGLAIGAFIEETLIAVINYTGITRLQTARRLKTDHHNILELQRLCIHPNYHKKNFASWFIAKSLKFIPKHIKTLVAFSDMGAGHSGTVYKAAGWIPDGKTKPSYWYVDRNGTRYYKKSVWDQAKRLQISEQDYANINGLHRINGLEVLRFKKYL